MAYISISVDLRDVMSRLTDDAINVGAMLGQLGDYYGDDLGCDAANILEGMNDDGRRFVRLLAAAIDAENA